MKFEKYYKSSRSVNEIVEKHYVIVPMILSLFFFFPSRWLVVVILYFAFEGVDGLTGDEGGGGAL